MSTYRLTRRAVALLVLLATVVAAFAVVDASAIRGSTNVDSSVGTARAGGATASLADPVTLSVQGDGRLETSVGDRVVANLGDRGADVTRVESLDDTVNEPVLVVAVTDADVAWSPIAPSSKIEGSFAYVQSGNATLARSLVGPDPAMVGSDRDAYVVRGAVTIEDRAHGVITRPAYRQRVATVTADAIVDTLAGAPGMDQPT